MRTFWKLAAAVVVATVVSTGTAAAGPCDGAERGTYLSNVCWLLEEFSSRTLFAPKVVSVNKPECTATVAEGYIGFSEDTVYFDRGNPENIVIERTSRTVTCWHLYGEGVSGGDSKRASVCGKRVKRSRIRDAFRNLYSEYCTGARSEF